MINTRVLDLVRITNHYGFEHQEIKLLEECGELTSALSRHLADPEVREYRENLIEELADVLVLMNQLVIHMGEIKGLEEYYNEKIDRQLRRMKEGI